jgi:hypothetical protein
LRPTREAVVVQLAGVCYKDAFEPAWEGRFSMILSRRKVLSRASMLGLAAGLMFAVSPAVASADDEDAMEPGNPGVENMA